MTEILDEAAVSEIEDRPARVNTRFEEMVILTPAERDALCATVKHLRAENEALHCELETYKPKCSRGAIIGDSIGVKL